MLQLACPAWGLRSPKQAQPADRALEDLAFLFSTFQVSKFLLEPEPRLCLPGISGLPSSPTIQTGALALADFGYWRGMSRECVTRAMLTPSQADLTPLGNHQSHLPEERGEW